MKRMIWVKSAQRQGWTCSECAWVFDDDSPPEGDTIDEMARNYERKRDEAFASHVCSQHPKDKNQERRTKAK
jgi:rubredoxin